MENETHEDSTFVTLSYEEMPANGSLRPDDLRNFIKRLRSRIAPERVRYFAVGEYGEQTERPHYHLALFGYPNCVESQSRYSKRRASCCANCDLIRDAWSLGNVFLGELNHATARYVAGYTTKKMTNPNDEKTRNWLDGRHPEFARMSTRPALGVPAVAGIIKELAPYIGEMDDVPSWCFHQGKSMPLGRTLRNHIRKGLGLAPESQPEAKEKYQKEMRDLQKGSIDDACSLSQYAAKKAQPQVQKLERLDRLFRKGESHGKTQ